MTITFTGSVAARLGLRNVYDEPYRFSATDGPEAFPGRKVALVKDAA